MLTKLKDLIFNLENLQITPIHVIILHLFDDALLWNTIVDHDCIYVESAIRLAHPIF